MTSKLIPTVIVNALSNPKFLRFCIYFNAESTPFEIFHAASPNAIAPTVVKIRPNRVCNRSDNELISSLRPSHSFSLSTIASILEETALPRKSYVGRSIPKSLPPIPAPEPLPLPLESSFGEIMFSSSIPSIAFFSFFAALVASPSPSDTSSKPLAVLPTEEDTSENISPNRSALIPNNPAIVTIRERKTFTTAITGGKMALSIGMNRLPIALAHCVTCACKTRSWLAGAFRVRAISP